MATVNSMGKSSFLKEFFVDHPNAGKAAVDAAWREAGNEGTISESLITQTRKKLGLTGKQSARVSQSSARGTAPQAAKANVKTGVERPVEPRSSGKDRAPLLIRLEGAIDDMLHEIRMAGGLPEFEEALRKARRILARSHKG